MSRPEQTPCWCQVSVAVREDDKVCEQTGKEARWEVLWRKRKQGMAWREQDTT